MILFPDRVSSRVKNTLGASGPAAVAAPWSGRRLAMFRGEIRLRFSLGVGGEAVEATPASSVTAR